MEAELFITLAIWLFFGWLCSEMAKSRNRSSGRWFVLGVLFSLIAVVVLLLLGQAPKEETRV